MPVIDFKEIPNPGSGPKRDAFEQFGREFLESIGYRVVIGPDRGPDAGRDLVVEEIRTGIAGETRVKWLVSCKHRAHSAMAVNAEDEPDIHDRVRTHGCHGFLALYATIPSSGLAAKLNAPGLSFEVQVYDSERIERHLLSSKSGIDIAERFFPESIKRWKGEHPSPARIFSDAPELLCAYCGKSLLRPEPRGIVIGWETYEADGDPGRKSHVEHVYWCCKGACDRALRPRHARPGLIDGWEDVSDLVLPVVYIRWIMVTLNELQGRKTYSKEAHAASKQLMLNIFPLVSRHLTPAEEERVRVLQTVPNWLGGLGYDE